MYKYILIILSCIIFAPDAQAFGVQHYFDVFLGPFNASHTKFEYKINKKDYSITSEVETFGVFDTLYPFKAQYSTTGKIKGDILDTTSYKYHSQSRFNKRSKELIYDSNGNPIYRLSSKNDKEKKIEIDNELNTGDTTDLQTVFAKLALQYHEVRFCHSRFEVFDGKKRFDVIFEDEGEEEIQKDEHIPHSLHTRKCSMYIDKLNNSGDDLLWQLTSDKPIYFWIAETQQNKLPYIAKVYVENTPLGALNAYTKKIVTMENE